MPEPQTARHAVAAQLLEEVDDLFARAEALVPSFKSLTAEMNETTKALRTGADDYRIALTAFNEQARAELSDHVDHASQKATAHVIEQHRSAFFEIARTAFRSQASDAAHSLATTFNQTNAKLNALHRARLVETALICAASSALTALLVWLLTRTA